MRRFVVDVDVDADADVVDPDGETQQMTVELQGLDRADDGRWYKLYLSEDWRRDDSISRVDDDIF